MQLVACLGQNTTAECPAMKIDCGLPRDTWVFAEPSTSYKAAFDLVCDRAELNPLLTSLYFFGFMLGLLCFGGLSDRLGRRTAYFVPLVVMEAGVMVQYLAQDFMQFAVGRVIVGIGNAGIGLIAFVWASEFASVNGRQRLAWLPNLFWALGQIFLSGLAYFIRRWRWLEISQFILGLGLFGFAAYLQESPQWLASKGRFTEAHKVLCACARFNGNEPPAKPPAYCVKSSEDSDMEQKGGGAFALLQLMDWRLLPRILIMGLAWFATSMGYYGLSLNSTDLPLDMYWANAFSALSTVPGFLLATWFMEVPLLGRRGSVAGGFLVAGLCLVLSCIGGKVLLIVLFYTADSALALVFTLVYIYGAELFPTDIRGSSMAFQSVFARVGAMAAPFVAQLGDDGDLTQALIIFGIFCLAAGGLTMCLPETRGQPLCATLADMQDTEESDSDEVAGRPTAHSNADLSDDTSDD